MAGELRLPKRGEVWRHYKGGSYLVMGLGHDEDGHVVVIYTPQHSPELYVRRLDSWLQVIDRPLEGKVGRFRFANLTIQPENVHGT